ncbi:AzlC family ABC transporter permease [Salininema proteolyticum]|uniref:AzlC family ABC transporter permease n=1 Tax=Salininema proteolyticum TaxID=1607685 RepID=A0ABV8U118_9ACTN
MFSRSVFQQIIPLVIGSAIIGVSFGAIATSSGLAWYEASLMSLTVFAGASQFAVVSIGATGSAVLAVAAGLVLNARHLPYGLAVGDIFWRKGVFATLLGPVFLIDESTAYALKARDGDEARVGFWTLGLSFYLSWNVGTLLGAFGGAFIDDPNAFGLDAAMPAALLALILTNLRDKATLVASVVGAAFALAATPYLPAGVPVLLALAGVVVAYFLESGRERTTEKETV